MATSKFPIFIERILASEGGYVNHPNDPGGETNWGIAKRSYPNVDIKRLTRAEAIKIYERDFWNPVAGDWLPESVSFQALDAAVNSGMGNAIRWLQRAADVADDGVAGPVTREALRTTSESDLLLRFNAARLRFLTGLSTWNTFGKGWARRIADNLEHGATDNRDS